MKYIKKFENYEVFDNNEGDNFWGNIGAGILPISTSGKILIALRSKYVNEPNTFGIWGGKLDDQETNSPIQGAINELVEESGYKGEIHKIIPAAIFEVKKNEKVVFAYHNFVALVDDFEPVLNWETESYKWVTYDELLEIEPKHFGLEYLLNNSESIIKKLLK